MNSAATKQLTMPEVRRPHASEIHEHKNRPAIAIRLTQITNFDASAGVIFSTMTNKVTNHRASATPPVWVSPVRQPAIMLRGYLKISSQRVCSMVGGTAGNAILAGSIFSAQASARRASSTRPWRSSQCGDSGTKARMYRHRNAGSKPTATIPRQPI